jgi:hypothetical protein
VRVWYRVVSGSLKPFYDLDVVARVGSRRLRSSNAGSSQRPPTFSAAATMLLCRDPASA